MASFLSTPSGVLAVMIAAIEAARQRMERKR
ncbi:hypothetical protein [Azospirillum argentinense]